VSIVAKVPLSLLKFSVMELEKKGGSCTLRGSDGVRAVVESNWGGTEGERGGLLPRGCFSKEVIQPRNTARHRWTCSCLKSNIFREGNTHAGGVSS